MQLNNDHNVYILGAGFSSDAGLPCIPEFLVRMRDSHPWLISQGRRAEAEAVQKVLEFRLEAASAAYWTNLDLENIEELFSLASASSTDINFDIQVAIAATLDFAQATHEKPDGDLFINYVPPEYMQWVGKSKWLRQSEKMADGFLVNRYVYYVAKLLGIFGSGKVTGENTFITFNYDTLIENALVDLRLPFTYGLEKQTKNIDHSAKVSNEDNAIPVLKLHGSLNWAKRRNTRGRSFTVYANYSDVREVALIPELVPPTWEKRFQGQLADVWASAVRHLQAATRVIVIGFSMPPTDVHFKYLLAAGLQQNVSLRTITFINPVAQELTTRANTVFRKSYIDSKKISFRPIFMRDLINDIQLLASIGRPIHHGATIQFQ